MGLNELGGVAQGGSDNAVCDLLSGQRRKLALKLFETANINGGN